MYIASNVTPEEEFRLTGTLRPEVIETLIVEPKDLDGVAIDIRDAMNQYPDEDFLGNVISQLRDLAGRLRGANRTSLLCTIDELSAIELSVFRAAEVGVAHLCEALNDLEKE